jgi:ligand-binding sensor domain-containing protein/two-component sensor histidine kinase
MGTLAIIGPCLSLIAKRFINFLLFFTGLLTGATTFSQEYNYIHYDVKDGLAGSTVYSECQDKYGFIWFATEAGISRFDGTHFKNFTTADGLPETEIILLFADSKGRIWMAPFKNTICYYYEGKIHNQDNDPLLKSINLSSVINEFHESADHDILFYSDKDIGVIRSNSLLDIFSSHTAGKIVIDARSNPSGKGFQMTMDDSSFAISGGKMTNIPFLNSTPPNKNLTAAEAKMKIISTDFTPDHNHILFTNTSSGSWMIDTTTYDRYKELFLKGKQVNHGMIDREKNIWFTTMGEGVYKLASSAFKSWYFKKNPISEIFSLAKWGNRLCAGSGFGRLYILNKSHIDTAIYDKDVLHSSNPSAINRLVCLKGTKNGELIVGTDGMIVKVGNKGTVVNPAINSLKAVDETDDGTLLVGNARRAFLLNSKDLKLIDTIWPRRTTAICSYNNAYYIGTVNGLYIVSKDKKVRYMGDTWPQLRQRVSCFSKSPNGTLWVAIYGAGVICMKNDQVINQITTVQGLSSNICRSLFLNNNDLWVGTDKGLNKVNIAQTPYPVTTYGTTDGLPSDIINAVYVDSSMIYVGTPSGLTFFDEAKVVNNSKCTLRILDISVSDKSQPLHDDYELKYREKSLRITYVGISFRSGGNIWYRYRLKGLKESWDSTTQTVLEYPSLPPGHYTFELIAINKKGIVSNPVKVSFIVDAAFWQTLPFQVLVIAVVILITWIVVAWRFSIIRKQEQEKIAIQQRLNDLEQMALRAQMNPHFIFNCLNSIQNFIIVNDLEASNMYLTEFAQLIRQTLDNSEKSTISITNEIKYLKRYLDLEMMRFGHSFNYSIEIGDIDCDLVNIPTMILQPYIENSIRHGIRYKESGKGHIDIKFERKNGDFICIIQDNGIGRKKANEYKSKLHVEYQSKGMSLTAERINILNRQLSNPITIEIIDLTDEHNEATGTKIVIRFPGTVNLKPVKNDTNRNY